jgi:hypothetical protein
MPNIGPLSNQKVNIIGSDGSYYTLVAESTPGTYSTIVNSTVERTVYYIPVVNTVANIYDSLNKLTSYTVKYTAPLSSSSPSPSSSSSIAQNKLLDALNNVQTKNTTDALNTLSTLTKGKTVSVLIPVPNNISSIFTSNPTTYPSLVGSTLPINIASTITNSNGNQTLDVNNVSNDSIVVVPSLDEGTILNVGSTNIYRGTGSNSNNLSLDNGKTWISIGYSIKIGNNIFIFSGIGSPVIFTIKARVNPVYILDYVFQYAYFFGFVGAIFYSISSAISIDILSVAANKNISIILNIYISACALISLFVWYNVNFDLIPRNIFNQSVVITSN